MSRKAHLFPQEAEYAAAKLRALKTVVEMNVSLELAMLLV
jgi:hypothetical protein